MASCAARFESAMNTMPLVEVTALASQHSRMALLVAALAPQSSALTISSLGVATFTLRANRPAHQRRERYR
jgi:hypothetical protein